MEYARYLKLSQLLSLQTPASSYKKEELIFIVAHQATELWFKVLLAEIKDLYQLFSNRSAHIAALLRGLNNCCLYWEVMIAQFNALAALSPLDFTKFRETLQNASGSQSEQYKFLEQCLGLSNEKLPDCNLKEAVFSFLQDNSPSPERDYLIKLYNKNHDYEMLINKLIEFDEWFLRWKYEHLRLVKRMIGRKIGTGYSTAEKLAEKSERVVFHELWNLKDHL